MTNIPEPNTARIHEEIAAIDGELGRSLSVVADAHGRLLRSFEQMQTEVLGMQHALESSLAQVQATTQASGADNAPQIMLALMQAFVSTIVETSQSSMSVVHAADDLSEQVKGIRKLIKSIQGIAAQTHVLGINASIEASRAGDAGQGFQVVAGEVRALAKETAKFSRDIGQVVDGTLSQLDAMRGSMRAMASRDVTFAVETQQRASTMFQSLRDTAEYLTQSVTSARERMSSHEHQVTSAIVGLQFEDIVRQILEQARSRLQVLSACLNGDEVIAEVSQAAKQLDLTPGSIDLF